MSRKPAPSANVASSGSGTSEERGTAASSAYAPLGTIAITRVPSSSSPASSTPSTAGNSGICG